MAKIFKKNLDAARRAPVRQNFYEAPAMNRPAQNVPKEYQTFEKARERGNGLLWLVFFLFIFSLAGFVFWTSQKNGPTAEESLTMTVTGPDKIVSGDQVTYVIKYQNLDIVPLEKMELDVRWPSGFYLDESSREPHDSGATTWLLDDLAVGTDGELLIKGQLVGQKDQELSAFFSLKYQPQNFRSDFKAKQEIVTKISDNKLELSIQSMDKALVSTEQEIKLSYKNISSETLLGLNVDVLHPDDYELNSVDPAKEGDYWVFNLAPGEEKIITLQGSFINESKNKQLIVSEIGTMVEQRFRRLARSEKAIAVVNPQFTINLEINGKKNNQAVDWGEVLRYQLEIINDSDSELTEVEVSALLDGPALDLDSLDTVAKREESRIIWTSAENSDLAVWPAGESRVFTWQLKVVDEKIVERNIENIIQINLSGLADWQQISTSLTLTVGAGLTFNSGVYWHLGGRRVGGGLLPPQVGEETQYLAVWSLADASGDWQSVVVESDLPPGVSFVSETDVQAGELSWDEDSQTLSWDLPDFSQEILPLTASFMISITPSEEQRGSAMTLFNPTTIAAQGQEELILRLKALKTTDVIANSTEPIGIIQ